MAAAGDHISGRSDTIDSVPAMHIAVVVYDGVFDSGLTSILDVLDNANALGGQIHEPPTWTVTLVPIAAVLPASTLRLGVGPKPVPRVMDCGEAAEMA